MNSAFHPQALKVSPNGPLWPSRIAGFLTRSMPRIARESRIAISNRRKFSSAKQGIKLLDFGLADLRDAHSKRAFEAASAASVITAIGVELLSVQSSPIADPAGSPVPKRRLPWIISGGAVLVAQCS